MKEFAAGFVSLSGGFVLEAPPEAAFELFSPLGEKLWVPGWSPELLHPPGVEIAMMPQAAYEEKMKRWRGWIDRHLSGR